MCEITLMTPNRLSLCLIEVPPSIIMPITAVHACYNGKIDEHLGWAAVLRQLPINRLFEYPSGVPGHLVVGFRNRDTVLSIDIDFIEFSFLG